MRHGQKRLGLSRRCLWCGLLLPLALVSGCGTFIETVTNKDFQIRDLFTHRNPVEVLRDSDDGAQRAVALRELSEPREHGGSREDQEFYIKVQTTAATSQNEPPLCRLAAIKALGRTKDPRAAEALKTVFLQNLSHTPEMNSIIRQQTLTALAETRQDMARELLIRVAKEPPAIGSEYQQETQDRRLAAIRGLAKYNHPDALETLLFVLKNDQDVAVAHRAHESLETVTGKSLPIDPQVWDRELHAGRPATPPVASQQPIQQIQRREVQPGQPSFAPTPITNVRGSLNP